MKKMTFLLFFLLLLTACRFEFTEEEIQGRLSKIAGTFPSTATDSISLVKTVSNGYTAYSASVELTWNGKEGRFSTEKALDKYSREFAYEVTRRIPVVSSLSLAWEVPFHAEDEPAMIYTYQRRKDGLTQTALEDRFTDGTFGADAFIDPDAMVEVPVRRIDPETATPQKGSPPQPAPEEASPPADSAEENTVESSGEAESAETG